MNRNRLKIKDLFEIVRLSCSEDDQLSFLVDSKKFFLSEPLRYWPFYGLFGVVSLSSVIFGLVILSYILVLSNLGFFLLHLLYSRFLYRELVSKWKKKLESLED